MNTSQFIEFLKLGIKDATHFENIDGMHVIIFKLDNGAEVYISIQ